MFSRFIMELGITKCRLLTPRLNAHTVTCPTVRKSAGPASSKEYGIAIGDLKRAERSSKCRYGFIPEEWFLFFHSKTGVSGPYLFALGVGNYLLSKEIYILEHEYYIGLSWLLVIYLVTTRLGPKLGEHLDIQVDEIANGWEKSKKTEIESYEDIIKYAKDAQWRAEGQKLLMDAKKENITMQLEAAYRIRFMQVYREVKGRMEYHVKKHRVESNIEQKWMITWILENVHKSITPELQKQAMESAIRDLEAAASRLT